MVYHKRHIIQMHFNLDLPLYPFCYEDVIREVSAWYGSLGVCYAMVIAVSEGEVWYEIENREYHLIPGKILFVPEFMPFLFHSGKRHHKFVLEIKGSHLTSILSALHLEKEHLLDVPEFENVLKKIAEIGNAIDTQSQEEFVSVMGKSYELLSLLAVLRLEERPVFSLLPRILAFLEHDFERKITISDLEKHTGINKATLIRLVKKHTGMTPMQYRIARKMERAVYFLQVSGMTVKEIAYQLGYCSQFYFAEEFKRVMGRSPTGYRAYQRTL